MAASKLSRKELKSDRFALEVGHTVDYLEVHRTRILQIGGAVLALIVLATGIYFYRNHQQTVRQEALGAAIQVQEAPVAPTAQPGTLSFPTEEAKAAEATKVFSKVATDYSGSDEGYIAEYYLGAIAADKGKLDEARKRFQLVADNANKNYASLAKLSLAQTDFAENRKADAEKLLHDLMDNPTDLVSKQQATIALAHGVAKTNPAEARKLLEPLSRETGNVSQVAITALAELGQ